VHSALPNSACWALMNFRWDHDKPRIQPLFLAYLQSCAWRNTTQQAQPVENKTPKFFSYRIAYQKRKKACQHCHASRPPTVNG